MKRLLKFIAKIMVVIVLIVIGLRYWLSNPTDESLIQNFEQNRSAFEELLKMIKEDQGLERVDEDWTRPDNPASIGVSSDRIAKYRQIFQRLKIPRGFYSFTNPVRIELIANTVGLSVTGSAKGYVFVESKPDLIVENLDEYHSPNGHSFTAHRHLDGNWYLYYDYEN